MLWMLTLISSFLFQSLHGQDSQQSQHNENQHQHHHHLHHLRKHEEQPHDGTIHHRFQVLTLADSVLCNNHSSNGHLTKNYLRFNEHGQEKSWTERLSQVSSCEVLQLQLITAENNALHDKNIHHLLSELFQISDASKSVRRIVIQFLKESHSFVSHLVDEMTTPRPWLDVVDETFPSLDSSEHSDTTTGTLYHIILDRYHQDYEDYLKLVSSVQFPDPDTCLTTPFMLNRKGGDHPGWASVLGMYYLLHSEMPFGITSIYVSNSNFVNQSTAFISSEDCPTLKNRWECAFLPTTNCSLPTFIKDCFSQNCVSQYPDSTYFSVVFTNMSDDAVYLSREHNETEYKRIAQIAKSPRNIQQTNYSLQYNRIPGLQYLVPRSSVVPATGKLDVQLITVAIGQVLLDNFYLRKNSFYRFKIQEYYKEFYERYPFFRREMNYFHPAEREFRCIAAHVRRGDRIVYGENMTDYCKTHQSHRDAGCGGQVPFGLVSLDGVVKKAELLVNRNSTNTEDIGKKKKYNLLIASDDPFWLEEQKELYDNAHLDSDWNIVTIFPSSEFNFTRTTFENQEKYLNAIRFIRYLGKTKSGVLFHSTIQLFQECDGFLGHFGSGVAWMLYRAMCHRNNLGKGICPPVYDLRSGLT
jgi:hypothetical protein